MEGSVRIALAVLMTFHGVAHLVSFVEAWRLIPQGFPYKTTVLAGHVDLGDVGIRAVGVIWLLVAVGFFIAAIGAVTVSGWWVPMAIGIAVASLLLSSAELPDARIGVVINLAIVGALVAGRQFGWV
jgi:hypothetical protein